MVTKSQLRCGYGSEFQLMRFLARHRKMLDSSIKKALEKQGNIEWLDFNFNGPMDEELIGLEFLSGEEEERIAPFDSFWPKINTNGPSWDAVGKINGEYILVEAKAHERELINNDETQAGEDSRKIIQNSLYELQDKYGIQRNDSWFSKHYQFANRLAFNDYLNSNGVQSHLVYVLFLNGYEYSYCCYETPEYKSIINVVDWKQITNQLMMEMGIIGTSLEGTLNFVYLDCNPARK